MKQYGIILGRMQPIHIGHQSLIDKVISDDFTPIVILGTAQEFGTKKNPYHPLERIHMVKLVYPDIRVYAMDDTEDWDKWFTNLVDIIKLIATTNLSEVTIYTHNKPEDLMDFTFKGVDYTNEYYSKCYEILGINTENIKTSHVPIRASSIRANLEINKQFLDPKVYNYIKGCNAKTSNNNI